MGHVLNTFFEASNTDMLCQAAHDIRSPLTALNMSIAQLRQTHPHFEHMEILSESIHRLNYIARDILKKRSIKSLKKKTFKADATLKEFYQMASFQFGTQMNLELHIAQDAEAIVVRGQSQEFQRILWNLAQNSLEASSKTFKIKATKQDKHLVITLSDNGCGMPRSQIEKIGYETFTTKESGHGMGLIAAVKKLQSWSASLVIKSEPLLGTQMQILLPISQGSI